MLITESTNEIVIIIIRKFIILDIDIVFIHDCEVITFCRFIFECHHRIKQFPNIFAWGKLFKLFIKKLKEILKI